MILLNILQYLSFLFATAAESLGIPYLSAYLNSIGSNFTQGANFATAGSSIRRQNTSLFLSGFSPISLDVQSWEFEQFINRSEYVYNNKGTISNSIISLSCIATFFRKHSISDPINYSSVFTCRRYLQGAPAKGRILLPGSLHLRHWPERHHLELLC